MTGEASTAIVELDDKRNTVLREGDVLATAGHIEKLVVLGYDEALESVKYYSNTEGGVGFHAVWSIPGCFDTVLRTDSEEVKLIELERDRS